MILKVQIPIFSNSDEVLPLIYNQNRDHWGFAEIPDNVFEAARELGKAYFHAEISESGQILWGKQADWQDW